MSAFAAQVVPGCSDWLTRPNYVSGMRSDNNQQIDTVTDSPPSTAFQLDYKYPMMMNVKQDPDEMNDFCRSGRRQSTDVTSSSYGCIEESLPRSRRTFGDELRLKRDWLMANGYRENHPTGIYVEPEAAEKDTYVKRRLPAVDELIQLQNDVIGVRGNADGNSTRQHFAADEPVDLSLIDQVNVKVGVLPPWNTRHVTQHHVVDQDQYRLLSCYSLEEQRNVLPRNGQHVAAMRERAAQRLPVPPSSPAVSSIVRLPKRDIPDEDESRDQVEYQPRRLTFAEHVRGRDVVRGMASAASAASIIDQDDKRNHHSLLMKQKFDFDYRQSPSEQCRSVGNSELKSRSAGVNHERRQTWPLDASVQPPWFRRQHQVEIGDISHSPAASDTMTVVRRDVTAYSGEFPVAKTDRCRTNVEERSPMSELIQLYDVTMASRAKNQPTGCEARQATTSKSADDGDDEIMSTGLPSNDPVDDDSMNSVGKKYVCHICPFVGDEKEQFDSHMKVHFDHWCPSCNYSSRTEGRLRCHIKMFHSELENAVATEGGVNKKRQKSNITCRHCDFTTKIKEDLWLHMRQHIQPDKMLECPRCTFVTDLKHHLEYHLRSSHIGSKPYKCDKCTYRCFNQSMLNSHAKSHTNVYQFRCRDCSFAAKYCHALKVHIRRYGHEAAPVLNEDGSQPTDGSGDFALVSRRGRPRGTRGQRDMPRFRSVRQRHQHDMDLLQNSSQSKSVAETNLNDADVHHKAGQFNVNPEIDRRFYPSSSQMAAAAVTHQDDGLYETVAGVLPSFSKFATNAAVGLPELFASNFERANDSRTRIPAFPERYDVTVPSRYPPPPGNIRDVVIDSYVDSRRHRENVPDAMDCAANRYLMNGSTPYVMKQPSAPSTYINYATGCIPSPIAEPERAQCGDLPLDLTLAPKSPQSEKTYHSQARAKEAELIDADTANPDDYDQVFRRRRHFRNWFQTQSTRQDSLNGSTAADQHTTSSDNSTSPRSAVFGCVPDIEFHPSPSTQFKTEVLDDIGGAQTTDDENKFESGQSYEVDSLEREGPVPLSTVQMYDEESLQCDSSLRGSPSQEGVSRGISSPSWVASGRYQCSHCEIDFHGCRTLHAIHMGYHSNDDPFQCNVCGEKTNDRVAFFIHLARVAHN